MSGPLVVSRAWLIGAWWGKMVASGSWTYPACPEVRLLGEVELLRPQPMRRFQAGEMGDSADMFEWSAYYQMWLSAQERVRLLEAQAV